MGTVTPFLFARQDVYKGESGDIISISSSENEKGHTDGSESTQSTAVKRQAPNQADLGQT